MKKYFLLVMMCIVSIAMYAEEYYIAGDIKVTATQSSETYVLHNPEGHNISFTPRTQITAFETELGLMGYRFHDVKTTCPSGKLELRLERWNYEEQKWIPDGESVTSESEHEYKKWTTIVLVLDKTNSLGDDFYLVKESAKSFINQLANTTRDNSNKLAGNVHIGIVAFAGKTTTFPITALTETSIYSMLNFIDAQDIAPVTGLYNAIDEAVYLAQNYKPDANKFPAKDFQGTSIITFTDGKDNGVSSKRNKTLREDAYQQYLVNNRLKTKINGKSINSYVMILEGQELKAAKDIQKLQDLASPGKFFSVSTASSLKQQFIDIANSLTVTWVNLVCFTPPIDGRVRWVLDCEEPKPAPKPTPAPAPKKSRSNIHELGAIVGVNNGLTYKIWNTNISFAYQLDLAYNVLFNSFDCQSNFVWQDYIADFNKVGLALSELQHRSATFVYLLFICFPQGSPLGKGLSKPRREGKDKG